MNPLKRCIVINAIFVLCVALCFALPPEAAAALKGKLSTGASKAASVPSANRSVLPKKGDIAVVVDGSNAQHVAMTEAAIVETLVSRGYRVVDEAKMKKIRAAAARAKAARLALEGNVAGIMKINSSYNAAATVVARVQAGRPELNEFKLYTGTASAAIMAVTSRGTKLGGKTAQSKQVGYTLDEAAQKAIDAAVQDAMALMF